MLSRALDVWNCQCLARTNIVRNSYKICQCSLFFWNLGSYRQEIKTERCILYGVSAHAGISIEKAVFMRDVYNRDFGTKAETHFKGTVSRDFLLQVFFMNHLPPSP